MVILFSELFLLFEVSLFWVEVVGDGLLLIVLSVEALSDVLFISWTEGAVRSIFCCLSRRCDLMEGVLF